MKEMEIAPTLAGAILREQQGGKYDMCFQETRISHVPFYKSIKQGGKESPSWFNLMMRSVFHNIFKKSGRCCRCVSKQRTVGNDKKGIGSVI